MKIMIPIIVIIIVMFLILLWTIRDARRKKELLKPTQFLNYNQLNFYREFDFKCEFCNKIISTKDKLCKNCGGTYKENKEYITKRKQNNIEYIEFIKEQEQLIKQEEVYIEKTLKALKKNWVMKNTFYDFNLEEKIHYLPVFKFDFNCEYCGSKLNGNSSDNKVCTSCGAGYKDNTDLLVMEQEEHLRKAHFDEYQKLKSIEWNQNVENNIKDTSINKNAKKIVLIILGLMCIGAIILYLTI